MPAHKEDSFSSLPSLDMSTLEHVIGGAGMDMSSMLPMMMMMNNKKSAAVAAPPPPPAAPPAPVTPQITLNGVPQSLANAGNNTWTLGSSSGGGGISLGGEDSGF
jgi:hypothetical protein